ncbi:nucleoside ABC transporter ATP-binding protein [Olsenella uli DSM 7084]|uniref:Nucleoside ABC transporter ATP-binding protein n=3 Tax=Olsenella uli TaxID=133926 RepID=E1QY60_OLSUV|nr:ABC transporter ATP-binding protein [Olsenella uli]ADK67324.1 nucleoside ABC transporter ATP-binding protein [Olsenella uli DSM 7084]
MEACSEYAVQMHGITKTFGTFTALDGVDLDVRRQTVHAILGENGAGKSTLMNVLYGLYQADSGEVYLGGERVEIGGPSDAIKRGIGMVHQHFMLVENFTVTENIILGDEVCGPAGTLDMRRAREDVAKIVDEYGFDIDPDAKIEDITVGMQQRVEILKALYRGADTLILDEPTAVLTPQEIEQLIRIMRDLVSKGKTIIIITHKLKEIMSSADVCTIIRRGQYMGTVDVADVDEAELAAKMVGRRVNLTVEKAPATPGETVLSIRDLHVKDERGIEQVTGLSLDVRAGEIVGIAGVDGNGQKELVDAITCLVKVESGTISVQGTELQNTSPRYVLDHGVATVHSDRHRFGMVLPMTVAENMVLERHGEERFGKGLMLDYDKMRSFTRELIEEFDIRPSGCEDSVAKGLSGGNQQKAVIAREVSGSPELLVAVQPTRGLDVGAIEFVHKTLVRERDKGKAVLLISLELDEVMSVSDTIDVIYGGKIVGSFEQGSVGEEELGLLMAGGGSK